MLFHGTSYFVDPLENDGARRIWEQGADERWTNLGFIAFLYWAVGKFSVRNMIVIVKTRSVLALPRCPQKSPNVQTHQQELEVHWKPSKCWASVTQGR